MGVKLIHILVLVKEKEDNLRKEQLLGDSLCGAQTPQRVNGSVQQCNMSVVLYGNITK